jgi:four helix bundle protein
MKENLLKDKSFHFAIRMVNLYKYLNKEHNESIISKQLIRSRTSVGVVIREAEHAESTKDFVHKLSISLKEANGSKYWLDLLLATNFITKEMYEPFHKDCEELLKMLASSVKTIKQKI